VKFKLKGAYDYFPYGKILRSYVPGNGYERYLTTQHERDAETISENNAGTGFDDRGLRMYDSDIARFIGVDPLAAQRAWLSPFNYVQNNPIMRTDPTGGLDGEYEKNESGNYEKVSTKGDEIGVDFYHNDRTDSKGKNIQSTYVTDRKGNWNVINNGRHALAGVQRNAETNWLSIFSEWETGTGPATSFFEGNHQTINGFKDHYLMNAAYDKFQNSGEYNKAYDSEFGISDIFKTGFDNSTGQAQMMGNYSISFYQLGDKTLTIGQDSKSRSSMYYHLPFIQNYERGVHPGNQEATTRQNYLFFK